MMESLQAAWSGLKGWQKAIVVVGSLLVLYQLYSMMSSSGFTHRRRGEHFRYLRMPTSAERPRAYMPVEHMYDQLPVGGMEGGAGATTWFAQGGKVGGMDNVKPAREMGYDRPDRLNIFNATGPAPSNSLTGVMAEARGPELSSQERQQETVFNKRDRDVAIVAPAEGQELLPADTVSLLDVDPTISGPGQPILTSLSDRNQDLSGRAIDFANARVPSDINDSEAPIPASAMASEGFSYR